MPFFFELLEKKIGLSRVGRITLSNEKKKVISTPNIVVPFQNVLMHNFNFLKEFETQDTFLISQDKYLEDDIIREKYGDRGFFYVHSGTLDKFEDILNKKGNFFSQNSVIPIIPFNIPTTTINKEFAVSEVKNFLTSVNKILRNNPTLDFGLSIKVFDYYQLIDLYLPIIKDNDNVKILNFVDLFDNLRNFRNIVKAIVQIKQQLDNNLTLMASGKIIPNLYPMLVYLGIDLIDSSYLQYLSSENFYDALEQLLPIYKVKYLPCSCVACRGKLKDLLNDKYSSEKIILLCLHNFITAKIYINKIKQYLIYEDYRAFVEKASLDNMNVISMLKLLDREYFEDLQYETPVFQENKVINCLGASSYYRPDFREFRERAIKYFTPEPTTKLIILLPCSAKKPYSESKSHRQFFKAIRKFPDFPSFQEIILTSPLGAIPRQFENLYPVNSYDISVTGEWDNEEKTITANMLTSLLEKYDKNIPIICHLEGEYIEIAKKVERRLSHTFHYSDIHERITSKESLQSLESLIRAQKDIYVLSKEGSELEYITKTWHRNFIRTLDYQYGLGAGLKVLPNELKLRKNRTNTRIEIVDNKTRELLGVYKRSSGIIELSIKGAIRLSPFSSLTKIIIFNGEKIKGNTLFRPGIMDYSSELYPRDNVIILDQHKKNVIGVGNMIVSSNYIRNSMTGRVAKIYERDK
jgi:archaeosine synthase